ncbi:MAG: metallophosphoesterase [Mahellales bacterium]|jgi:predicted MPP superfamily phosphohydrolase
MVHKSKRFRNFLLFICVIAVLIIFFTWQNNAVVVTNYEYTNAKLPPSFNNLTILQISDLHNKDFHGRLSQKVKELNPDIIVVTGDLIDRRSTKTDIATEFIKQIGETAPIYYVSGNHEQLSGKYKILKAELQRQKVHIMDNSYKVLNEKGYEIGLLGIGDPAIYQTEGDYLWDDGSGYVREQLDKLLEDMDTDFNILLSHRPEQFPVYRDMKLDLVFSGHAHGGQIRLPLIGGLYAPHQGLFPKYTAGVYNDGNTSMVVSRGLGNSVFPVRVFNRPELVVVTLICPR